MEFSEIRGIGEKRIESLRKAGIFTPADLLFCFPKKYLDTSKLSKLVEVKDGEIALFLGSIIGIPVLKRVRKGLFFVRAEFEVDGGKITCVWFNNRYIINNLKAKTNFLISGKVKRSARRVEMVSPELYDCKLSGIVPIYPVLSGITRPVLKEAIAKVLENVEVASFIPPSLAGEYQLLPLMQTIRCLHQPSSMLQIDAAKRSIALETLSCELAAFFIHKDSASGMRSIVYQDKRKEVNSFIKNNLPYPLSSSQERAVNDIISSLLSDRRMNRLLQGDVGSGKTIVAFIAMYFAYLNGYQAVLMAPTEILARQHFENAVKLFDSLGVKTCLMTGSQSRLERQDKLFNIKNHLCDFVIGTHAVIQDDVEFKRLSLIITDEQQRFGVQQRGKLENKSQGTDTLILSATPIPRTLSLVLYGELEQSSLERHCGKKAVTRTKTVPTSKLSDMYDYIAKRAQNGEKTYIVCARIEDDEDEGLVSVNELAQRLQNHAGICEHLAILHGQMKDDEKTRIMNAFYNGEHRVLISTTVIEVGIDVPDATTIVIFNPERFGLSQLHQLRGRVGRGELDSYCFLVLENVSETVAFFAACEDGFQLAEYDFQNRGAGDFLGTRQHGGVGCVDADTILKAKAIATKLLDCPKTAQELRLIKGSSIIKDIALN